MDAQIIPEPPETGRDQRKYLFLSRVLLNKENGCWEWAGGVDRGGYARICIGGRQYFAHRYSAFQFLGYDLRERWLCVCHKCDNRRCVNPYHFFIGSRTENMRDCYKKGRMRIPFGEKSGKAKLTEDKVREARNLFESGSAIRALARQFGVSNMAMSQAVHRQSWKHVT